MLAPIGVQACAQRAHRHQRESNLSGRGDTLTAAQATSHAYTTSLAHMDMDILRACILFAHMSAMWARHWQAE